ncbi:sedoheptulokinase-like isoform X2 [Biomphalaria glabrata]|nr:sedoheptulokinase-like isoform X2 [Biomphalaria glabrata]XP_055861456.1 sedoheptulokinase-like isoform X2 [Biomphalaria glabrata]XP_055861457.1 sedoheptulokinase-like isoform X2 [Biomphalaria glabrata]XP_055861458.1 sedoheptulokinase-like isoform X2 [Biomphalaria glabrata]
MSEAAQDDLWLGLDLGTTSAKAVLLGSNGVVLASQSCPTCSEVASDIGDRGYEQSPIQVLKVLNKLVLSLVKENKMKITGIGVTGQMHGVMFWGKGSEDISSLDHVDNSVTSNLFTWQDQRCTGQILETLPKIDQSLSTGFGCATMFWLARNRPGFFKDGQYTCCGSIVDYLVAVLCGLDHPVTSDQLAASFGYFDETLCHWSSILQEDKEFPVHLLPTIVRSGEKVGQVNSSFQDWPTDVPVYVGMGDVQCAMYAALSSPQHAVVNISTSIQLGFVIPEIDMPRVKQECPESIAFFPYFFGQKLALFAGLNGGNVIQHLVESLIKWFQDLGIHSDLSATTLLPRLQQLADLEINRDTSLSISPILFGERHDPGMCGHIKGITSTNVGNIGAVFKAVSEGLVDHLHAMVPTKFLTNMGIHSLIISGSVPVNNIIVRERLNQLYSELELTMDCEGQDAVGSAVGAAKFVRDCQLKCYS